MDKEELNKLIEKYKQEMLEMAKSNPSVNTVHVKEAVANVKNNTEVVIEGQILYPVNEEIGKETVYEEIESSVEELEGETQDFLDFVKNNPKQGFLKIQAYTAKQAIPINNVTVEISKNFNGIKKLFYSLKTDLDGIIDGISLPAPDSRLSQQPSNVQPFATYDIYAKHPNYTEKNYLNVPVFDGIKSIQVVDLEPVLEPILYGMEE